MITVGWFFGGRSTEHEVSVISALMAYNHLDKSKYTVVPVYVSKNGDFYTNPKFLNLKNYKDVNSLLLSSQKITLTHKNGQGGFITQGIWPKFTPLGIAFPIFHGSFGEDGCIQGLFEMNKIPYTGFGVTGSAVGMDKVVSKLVFQNLGLAIAEYAVVQRLDWNVNAKQCLKDIQKQLKFPLFVKPATSGSSIGVNKAKNEDELSFAIEVAMVYSQKVLIEEAFQNVREVNCSALGYKEVKASVCEMPIASEDILTFDDKYKRGGKGLKAGGMSTLDRIIPAPIPEKLSKEIQDATIKIFKAFDGCGVARVDYFVDLQKNTFWANEINTPPGDLSFYLWKPSGVGFKEVLDTMIEAGLERSREQSKTQYTFESGLLSQMASAGGLKNQSH